MRAKQYLANLMFTMVAISSTVWGYQAPNKFVGVLYEPWFNYIQRVPFGPPNPGGPNTYYPYAPYPPNFMYWGKPALGFYKSDDPVAINTHADQIAAAGIDFIVVDFSNGGMSSPDYSAPLFAILNQYTTRIATGKKTPKIVFLTSATTQNEVQYLWENVYQQYSSNLFLNLGAHPLLLVNGFAGSCSSTITDMTNFSCRVAEGLEQNGNQWQWLNLTPQYVYNYPSTNGWPEQLPVSPAQQETYMNASTAHGRKYDYVTHLNNGVAGKNYSDQWLIADTTSPTYVLINSWNQWAAQNIGNSQSLSYPAGLYTDEFNEEFSTDIEPEAATDTNSHTDAYLTMTAAAVAKFKQVSASFFIRDATSGNWFMKYGRGWSQFSGNNFTNTFSGWAAGANYQAIVDDFDGDGYTDIGLRDTSTGNWYFAFYIASQNAFFNTRSYVWSAKTGSRYQAVTGDFHNVGHADIALRDSTTGTWSFVFYDTVHGTYSSGTNFAWSARSGTQYQPFVGDFNGDGHLDLGVRDSSTGTWYFAMYNATTATYSDQWQFAGWVAGSNYQPVVGDFDCDGLADIGLRNSANGYIYLANNLGTHSFANQWDYVWQQDSTPAYTVLADPLECR